MKSAVSPSDDSVEGRGVVLRAEGITKHYGGIVALDRVNYDVYQGQVNVLVGENGAGKSTLMKILAGVEYPTSGNLFLNNHPVAFRSPLDAARAGIGIIYQELSLFPNLSVKDNILMTREPTHLGVVVNQKREEELVREVLERLDQPINPRAFAGDLPVGQQQIVEIARALTQNVRILIMDEPTSALSAVEVEALFRVVKDLREHGVAIVYVSHRLEELMPIGDRITVLRDGHHVAEALVRNIDVGWIIEKMVGQIPKGEKLHIRLKEPAVVLEVSSLTCRRADGRPLVDNVSFDLRRGEILGLYGLMGAGRTELLECLAGSRASFEGKVSLSGEAIEHMLLADRLQKGLILVPEDRQGAGIVQSFSSTKNLTLSSLKKHSFACCMMRHLEKSSFSSMAENLRIDAPDADGPITSLSGGNQQKVVVGRGLLTSPQVLLLDEPTRGIDVAAKAEMFDLMRCLAGEGKGILFVSSDLKEIVGASDRILVMSNGRITGEFTSEEATENALVAASSVGHGYAGVWKTLAES
jgi:erythritol transport system ATP-binding protein